MEPWRSWCSESAGFAMTAPRGHFRPVVSQTWGAEGTLSPVCIRFAGSRTAAYPNRWANPALWILAHSSIGTDPGDRRAPDIPPRPAGPIISRVLHTLSWPPDATHRLHVEASLARSGRSWCAARHRCLLAKHPVESCRIDKDIILTALRVSIAALQQHQVACAPRRRRTGALASSVLVSDGNNVPWP